MIVAALRIVVLLLLASGLSGCFVSKQPLITKDQATFPYSRIVYGETDSTDVSTLVHEGDAYVLRNADGEASLLFKDVGDGFYVVQVESKTENDTPLLFALLKVDLNAKTVDAYNAVAKDEDQPAGLSRCAEDATEICVDNLDAYVDFAKKAVAGGEDPDTSYRLVSVE